MLRLKQIFDNDKLGHSITAYKQNQRDAKALWALHYYYKYGWCETVINPEKALACLERAALEGHAGASYKLAEYFLDLNDEKSLILAKKYISKTQIQLCKDKTDDCNDEPYYNQQHYIVLLEGHEAQTLHTTENTIRHRFKPQ
jgi:TPR repeat protein